MGLKKRSAGRAMSMPMGIGLGILIGMIIMIAGSVLLTFLIMDEHMDENGYGFGIMVLHFVASLISALFAMVQIKHRKLLVCGLTVLGYFLSLMAVCSLFFGGEFTGMGTTAILVLAGGVAAAIAGLREKNTDKRKYKMASFR